MARKEMTHYQLLVIHGGVEPELVGGEMLSWEGLETELMKVIGNYGYDPAEDSVFYLTIARSERIVKVHSFSEEYMSLKRAEAGLEG